ncbi:MAG: ABC transporter permease [Thermomicrobiales bacterium]
MDMQRIWLVAKREWWSRFSQRSFRIVTLVQVLGILVAACLPTIIARFSGDSSSVDHVIVVDQSDANVAARIAPLFTVTGGDESTAGRVDIQASTDTPDAARQQVSAGDVDAALIVTRGQDGNLAFSYESKDGATDALAQRIYAAVASISMQDRLQQEGVSEQEFAHAATPPSFTIQATEAKNDNTSDQAARYTIGFIFAILMYMAIILYGMWIAQGVVEEKSSRIMEIMINAATPRDLLAGKVIGIGLAAATQLVPMMLVGGIAFALQPRLADALNVSNSSSIMDVDFGAISAQAVGLFAIYFLLGFILYASLYASIASLLSRQEEVSQAVSPLMTFTIVGYLGALFTLSSPNGLAAKILSLFPFTSPFSMVPRSIVGDVPVWELVVSLLLLAAAAVAGVLFASRVYRVGVLMYGQKPSWRTVLQAGGIRVAR